METLRVNIFNTSSNLPLLAAQANGYLAARGIEVEIQNTPNSDEQRAGLAAGQFDIAHAAVDNAVAMVESAAQDVVIVCGGDAGMNDFMVRNEINTMDDLRGKLLAVDAPNTAYALAAKKILELNGLIENRDYTVRLAGGTGPRAAAMVADPQLAAAMINPPFSFSVLDKGLKSLGSQFDLLGPYQATGAFVMRTWAIANAQLLERYLAAYIEGQRHVLNPANRAAMVALLTSRFKLSPDVAQGTYDALVKPGSGLAVDARFSREGFEKVLAIRAEMEGMWGGTPPPATKYLDLGYFERALVDATQPPIQQPRQHQQGNPRHDRSNPCHGYWQDGLAEAQHFLAAGHSVSVSDPSAERLQLAREQGLSVAQGAEVTLALGEADRVFSSLPDDGALATGAATVAASARRARSMSIRVPCRSRPPPRQPGCWTKPAFNTSRATVSGNNKMAEAAQLTVMASGPRAAHEAVLPLLKLMGPNQFYLGDGEQARLMKLVVNLMIAQTSAMLSEALALGRNGGLDWRDMWQVLSASAVASPILKAKAVQLSERDFTPTFTVHQMIKDLDLILGAGEATHTPLAQTALTHQLMHSAVAQGDGADDYAAIIKAVERSAGLSTDLE